MYASSEMRARLSSSLKGARTRVNREGESGVDGKFWRSGLQARSAQVRLIATISRRKVKKEEVVKRHKSSGVIEGKENLLCCGYPIKK